MLKRSRVAGFNDEITNQLDNLINKDIRIILGNFNETWARWEGWITIWWDVLYYNSSTYTLFRKKLPASFFRIKCVAVPPYPLLQGFVLRRISQRCLRAQVPVVDCRHLPKELVDQGRRGHFVYLEANPDCIGRIHGDGHPAASFQWTHHHFEKSTYTLYCVSANNNNDRICAFVEWSIHVSARARSAHS